MWNVHETTKHTHCWLTTNLPHHSSLQTHVRLLADVLYVLIEAHATNEAEFECWTGMKQRPTGGGGIAERARWLSLTGHFGRLQIVFLILSVLRKK